MADNTILVILVGLLSLNFLYKKYIEYTKDVPEIFLNEQSSIDYTRLANESAVYKSNKLDYGGLRVGLEIRYDHYKLRHGNFCDVWGIFVSQSKKNPEKTIVLNDQVYKISRINYMVTRVCEYLLSKDVTGISIPYDLVLSDIETFVVVFACLINSIILTIYDDQASDVFDENVKYTEIRDDISHLIAQEGESSIYVNEYSFEKDRGVRIKAVQKLNNKIIISTEYLTVNFMSSIASSLRHLPLNEAISNSDTFVIVNSKQSVTQVISTLNKLFTSMVSQAETIITDTAEWDKISKYEPSIVAVDRNSFDFKLIDTLKSQLSVLGKLTFKQSLKFLSKGKFSKGDSKLRLLYISLAIHNKSAFIDTGLLNQLRALLNTRVIVEYGYNNLVGPVVLNDFYDYRILSSQITAKLSGFGCLCQSIESKLVNLDSDEFGDIVIRGYNIGKVEKYLVGKGLSERVKKNNEGFMQIEGVKGRWGNDGCLYVYSV